MTIPVGQEMFSDPVSLTFSGEQDLAVSLFLPNASGPATYRQEGQQDSFVSTTGDFAQDSAATSRGTRRRGSDGLLRDPWTVRRKVAMTTTDCTSEIRHHDHEGGRQMMTMDPGIRFPGESAEYRRERNRLIETEAELRRAIEQVAAQRRALPPGGVVPDDYRFEKASDGSVVLFSELFEAGNDTLVIYSFMFPRYSGDPRPGPAAGETARLPLAETPCPSCTSILDSLDGAAPHLAQRLNLAVVAKSDPDRIRTFARDRGWRHLRLLSSHSNSYNRDYHAETPDGEQMPMLNVFVRDGERFRHTWASELMYTPRDEGLESRHVDSIWPIWNVLDVTPDGRGTGSNFPALRYD